MIKHHHSVPVNPKRVVILGASGFVARALADHLASASIETLSISSSRIDLFTQESVQQLGDVLRPEDALVITSALTPEKGKDVRTFMKNLSMVEHVAASLANAQCAQVVYISSDSVYDEGSSLVREDTPRNPNGLYGLMHVAREQMLQYALAKKAPLCIVRPSAIYGAGDTHNSYGPNRSIRTALKEGKVALFGNGEEQRDHIYIKDVTRFLALCLLHKAEGAMNIVSGQAVSFYDLAQEIASLCGTPVRIECSPRMNPISHRHFDVTLRLRHFPQFKCTPLKQGLSETINELRSGQI